MVLMKFIYSSTVNLHIPIHKFLYLFVNITTLNVFVKYMPSLFRLHKFGTTFFMWLHLDNF